METDSNKILFSWAAPEFIRYEKSPSWFIGLGVITAGLFIAFILMKNYFFALIILLAAFLIYVQAQKYPRKLTIEITDNEIKVGNFLSLPHQNISSFWIFEESENKSLSLETKNLFQPKISLLLMDAEPSKIRDILIGFLPEKKHEESLIDIIAKKLRF